MQVLLLSFFNVSVQHDILLCTAAYYYLLYRLSIILSTCKLCECVPVPAKHQCRTRVEFRWGRSCGHVFLITRVEKLKNLKIPRLARKFIHYLYGSSNCSRSSRKSFESKEMMNESRSDHDQPPPAKRARLLKTQDSNLGSASGSSFSPPSSANVHGQTTGLPAGFVCEFPVRNLEDFYKPCPNYRLPMEVGSFSLNAKGKVQLDRSQLRYYTPPLTTTRVMLDLRVGYDKFVPKKENVPANKLNPILEWINGNGDCFRPRTQPLSPPHLASTTTASQSSSGIVKNGALERSTSLEVMPPSSGPSTKER